MGTYSTRLGCSLQFSEEQEADIVEVIEQLNRSHSLGRFLSNLIRVGFESPDIIDRGDSGRFEYGHLMRAMENLGIHPDRKSFFDNVTKEVAAMKRKVDEMYNTIMKTYTLALMNKELGILEERADNDLAANFLLEKQIKELQTKLGVVLSDSVYLSSKMDKAHKQAEDDLEYILETYSGIIDELRTKLTKASTLAVAEQPTSTVVANNNVGQAPRSPDRTVQSSIGASTVTAPKQTTVSTIQDGQQSKPASNIATNIGADTEAGDDELVDFGEASNHEPVDFKDDNLDLLMNYFNV